MSVSLWTRTRHRSFSTRIRSRDLEKGYTMGVRTARLGDSLHFEARNLTLTCRKFCSHSIESTVKGFLVDGKHS